MAKIYLVAGHGGSDPGACGHGRQEKHDTLSMTLDVGKVLSKLGHTIKYNRTTDIDVDYYGYINSCNAFGADICVSIHRNSFNGQAYGYETCVYSNDGISKTLADSLNSGMSKLGFYNRGTKVRPDLAILNSTNMPAVLLEVGFIDNINDNQIYTSQYNNIIQCIVNSILKALGLSSVEVKPSALSTPSQKPVQPSKPSTSNTITPVITYGVKTKNYGILTDVKNRENFAGWGNDEIVGVKIGVNVGAIKYRVHTVNGKWFGWVTGNNWNDYNNGYAGDDANAIDAIEVYYETDTSKTGGKYYRAKYQVKGKGMKSYWDNQYDNEKDKNQDGYAGAFGIPIVELLMSLE